MTQLTDKGHWAVELPDDAEGIHLGFNQLIFYSEKIARSRRFPPGNWQYLFTTKGCTEEDARKVVGPGELDKITKSNKYTVAECKVATFKVDDPVIAFNFLLKSKGCDIKKNWAIIQKVNDNG